MIDYETLGHIPPNLHSLSLGVVLFNAADFIKTGYWTFSMSDQIKRGREISADTLSWWMKQGPEAQTVLRQAHESRETEAMVMQSFHGWVGMESKKNLRVWSAGAGFDIPIIEHQLRENDLEIPWMFWNHRCYRTMKSMFDIEAPVQRQGVKHNALDDAKYQAQCVQAYLRLNPKADK
jgi:hypothetical protein